MGVATWSRTSLFDELPYIEVRTLGECAKQTGCLTCDSLYLPDTHYIGYRTLPCLGKGCGACERGTPRRHEAFASIIWQHNRRHEIVRLTPVAAGMIEAQIPAGQSVRGYVVTLERRTKRRNGRLVAHVEPDPFPGARLPEAPNLEAHLYRIWRIDGIDPSAGDQCYIAQLAKWIAETEAQKLRVAEGTSNVA